MFGIGAPITFLIIIIAAIISGVKVLKEYERGVVFRLGRMVGARGPGLVYIIPGIEKMVKMDLRTVTMDIPPQDVITRDNVSVKVNAVLYFRVLDPNLAVREVENYLFATSNLPKSPCAVFAVKESWTSFWRNERRLTLAFRISWISRPIRGE
jgi:regulator of protease activity HflC (stomatin/prohibitin superfamily)